MPSKASAANATVSDSVGCGCTVRLISVASAPISIGVRSPDREDWLTHLNFKIQMSQSGGGGSGYGGAQQSLRIELTDRNDPYFLYLMECGENEFHSIKHEQNILVDFQAFPSKLIEMLEYAVQRVGEEQCRFQCLLETTFSNEGTFSIVEPTQFRQLMHLSLRMKAGGDEAVKRYLAERVRESCETISELRTKLESAEDALQQVGASHEKLSIEMGAMNRKVADARDEGRRLADSTRLDEQKRANELKEKMLLEQSETMTRYEKELEL